MDITLLMEYGWTLLVLVGLEGLLAADNALVLAIMVKHLPADQRKKALFYGLAGAFLFRFSSLFVIAQLIHVWQLQAAGAVYLLYLGLGHLLLSHLRKPQAEKDPVRGGGGFWATVVKVEVADITFAVDSILAAVALAMNLPRTGLPSIGGLDGGQFAVVFTGGLLGLMLMRLAANKFVALLHSRPGLEKAAYAIVAWVGVKLMMYTLAHPQIGYIDAHFVHSATWKVIFWGVLLTIFGSGLLLGRRDDGGETA